MNKLLFLLLFATPFYMFGQLHSWDGQGLPSRGTTRCLNIFVNIIYDEHPEYNDHFPNSNYWPPVDDPALEGINNTAIPTYLLNWMDTVYVPGQIQGYCTRLFGESSFDSLRIIGDFVVVNLCESTARAYNNDGELTIAKIGGAALNLINTNGGLQTLFGHDKISDYDNDLDGKLIS